MEKFILFIVLSIPLTLMNPIQSKALSCVELEGPAIDYYDVAIVGTVLNVKSDIEQAGFTGPKEEKTYILVDVEKSLTVEVDSQVIFEADFT